jgi:hypothetical protein
VSDGDGLGKVMVIFFVVGMWLSAAVFYVGIGYAVRAIRLPVHPLFRDIEELLLREYAIIPTFVAFLARSAGLAGLESFFGLAAIHICTGGEPDIPPRHAQIGMVLMLLVHAVCVYPRIRGHVRSLTEVQE